MTSRPTPPLTDAWLAPDGTLHRCAPFGHIYVAKELYDDREEVRAQHAALAGDAQRDSSHSAAAWDSSLDNLLTEALERLGYLKLSTRFGRTDWSWHQSLTHVTPAQLDTLLAVCREMETPWPAWCDRETRRLR